MPEHEKGRPTANRAASNVISNGDTLTVTPAVDVDRCTRCNHPIHAEQSLRLGMGPDCRRREVTP